MDFFGKVASQYAGLTDAEKRVADYIRANPALAVSMNTKALGQAAGASPATVVRFARAMGYDSYQQLLIDLARSGLPGGKEQRAPDTTDDLGLLTSQLLGVVQTAMVQTVSIIGPDVLLKAAHLVREAPTIYLYGVGASGLVAQDFMQKLIFVNKRGIYYSDYSLSITGAANIIPADLAIGFSYSGRNREVLFSMEAAKKKGAKTIGFTRVNSQLAKLVDLQILMPHVDERVCEGSRLSRYAQSIASDMLYLALLHTERSDSRARYNEVNRILLEHSTQRP